MSKIGASCWTAVTGKGVFSCLPLGNMKMQASPRSSGLRVCMLSANNLTCVCNSYRDRRYIFVDGERLFVKGKTD